MSKARPLLQPFTHIYHSFDSWQTQYEAVRTYWHIYGGLASYAKSPYVHAALFLTSICVLHWAINDKLEFATKASEVAISVLPNLLGFTVGALAIVLAFSSADIFKTLAEDSDPRSFFVTLTANLVHYISMQVLALSTAITARIVDARWLDVLSLFLLYYAVLATFAAAIQLFQTALIYNAHASIPSPVSTPPSDVPTREPIAVSTPRPNTARPVRLRTVKRSAQPIRPRPNRPMIGKQPTALQQESSVSGNAEETAHLRAENFDDRRD